MFPGFTPTPFFGNGHNLFYMEYGQDCYWVYDGKFSEPMSHAFPKQLSDMKDEGGIVAGQFNENGFFAIQQISGRQYRVNINNRIYQTVEGVDKIDDDWCFFDGTQLVFYAIKDNAYYQYVIR